MRLKRKSTVLNAYPMQIIEWRIQRDYSTSSTLLPLSGSEKQSPESKHILRMLS